ncbi:MAG: zinc ribbon domain-containing protein [Bryobacteraceae bacterium]
MPIYEYHCNGCGADFEKRVARASDSDSVTCPSCGERDITQKLSTFAPRMGSSRSDAPMCPSAGCCPNAGICGKH